MGDRGESQWQVVGAYRVIYGSGFVVEPIYAPLAAVREQVGNDNLASQLLIKGQVSSLAEETSLVDRVTERMESAGLALDFYTTTARQEQRVFANNQFASVISTLLGLAMLVATVGGMGLAGALGISVVERTREIGVLRSIGARSPAILRMLVIEGVLQGLFSFLIATPLSFVLAQPLARQLGMTMLEVDLDFAYDAWTVGVWLVMVMVISVVASITPARRATKISVRESLSYS